MADKGPETLLAGSWRLGESKVLTPRRKVAKQS